MSGGRFNYIQHSFADVADNIEKILRGQDDDEGNYIPSLSAETIEKFRLCQHTIRLASEMVQRVDWLMCGDDGEDSFHRRWEEEVSKLEDQWNKGAGQ